MTSAAFRYSVTTCEPGARLVLTHGLVVSPRSFALRASNPAAIITDGFDVFVQLVIAAITTEPCVIGNVPRSVVTARVLAQWPGAAPPSLAHASIAAASAPARVPSSAPTALRHDRFESDSGTRSCGRLGPASDGTTDPR